MKSEYFKERYKLHFSHTRLLIVNQNSRSSLSESITQHLYGVSRKDHINYSYISSIDDVSNDGDKASETLDVNQLSAEQRRVILPSFKELVNYVIEMSNKRMSSSSTQHYVYGRAKIAYSYEIYTEVIHQLFNLESFSKKPSKYIDFKIYF